MEETKALLRQLHEDNVVLGDQVVVLSSSMRRRDRALVLVLVALLIIGYVIYRDRQFRSCMTDWAGQFTTRSQVLSGPGVDRVDLLLKAYNEAAGAKHTPLTKAERARLIAGLDQDRVEFSVLPKHAALAKMSEPQLLGFRDLIAALRANAAFHARSNAHPVPSAPSCGGLF